MLQASSLVYLARALRLLLPPFSRWAEEQAVKWMLASRHVVSVQQVTVSTIIQEQGLERVDLLKVRLKSETE